MNLYKVWPKNEEYFYFVFAPTRNKAKTACAELNTDAEIYIDLRSRTLVKGIFYFPVEDLGGVVVVEDENDVAYDIVKELGFGYETVC